MFTGEFERRCEFLVGIRLGSWDWEDENFGTSLASCGDVDVLVIFRELQGSVRSHGEQIKTCTHGNGRWRPVPMRGQRVRFILLQVVNDENGTVRFIPVLSELSPSDFGTVVAESRVVGGTMFPGGDLFALLTLEIDDENLRIRSITLHQARPRFRRTFCLVCHAGGSSGSSVVYTRWVFETSKSSFPPNGSMGDL